MLRIKALTERNEILEKEASSVELTKAVQQFTGYHAAVTGPQDVCLLADAMGLTDDEYRKIRDDIHWLRSRDREELDEHFNFDIARAAGEPK